MTVLVANFSHELFPTSFAGHLCQSLSLRPSHLLRPHSLLPPLPQMKTYPGQANILCQLVLAPKTISEWLVSSCAFCDWFGLTTNEAGLKTRPSLLILVREALYNNYYS